MNPSILPGTTRRSSGRAPTSPRARFLSGRLAAAAWLLGLVATFVGPAFLDMRFRDKWLPLLALSIILVANHYRSLMAMARYVNPGMVATLSWALLSAAWAPSPTFVLTQSAALIGVSLIALAFSLSGWQPDRFERLLAQVLTAMMIASICVAVAYPALGIHSEDDVSLRNSWRGITLQKNILGQMSSIALILWTYLWAARRVRPLTGMLGIALTLFVLLSTRSSTSLMLAVLCSCGTVVMLRPVLNIGTLARRAIVGAIAVLVPLITYLAVATSHLGFIGAFFGKDGSFSGRTDIWHAMMLEIQSRPLLGTGLASFWGGMDAGEARVRAAAQWGVRNGHNGYIDVVNELGLIGLLLFFVFLIAHCIGLAKLARASPSHYALHLPLFVYLVLANTSESGWFFPIAPTHLVGMYASLEVSRLLLARDLHLHEVATAVAAPVPCDTSQALAATGRSRR